MDSSFETSGLPNSAKLGFLSSKVLNRGKTLFLTEDARVDPFFCFYRNMAMNTIGNSPDHADAESSPINFEEIFDVDRNFDHAAKVE